MNETTQAQLPEANPPVSAKPPVSYNYRLKCMNIRQLRGEVNQFIPGTRRNLKRTSQADVLSTAFATVLTAFLDSHQAGRVPYVR